MKFLKKNHIIIILVSLIVIVIGVWTYKCYHSPAKIDPYKELVQKIDSLNNEIKAIELKRDTINN